MIRGAAGLLALVPAALLLAGCLADPTPVVPVDIAAGCRGIELLDLGGDVTPDGITVAIAGDAHGSDNGWALATNDNATGLWRLPSAGGPPDVPLTLPPGTTVGLYPGAYPGETWLLLDAGVALGIWKITPDGVVAQSEDLHPFPAEPTSDWTRSLVFIEDQPFLFAAPRSSDSASLDFWLAPVSDDLGLESAWSFSFGVSCDVDPEGCQLATFPRLRLLDVAEASGRGPGLVLFDVMEEYEAFDLRTVYAMTLRFTIDVDRQTLVALLRTGYPFLSWEFSSEFSAELGPGDLVVDETGYYILAGLELGDLDPGEEGFDKNLIRHSSLSGLSTRFATVAEQVSPHLLQLDGEAALGQFVEGTWRALPLYDTDIDFDGEAELALGAPDTASLRTGGRGQYIVRYTFESHRRTAVRCGGERSERSAKDPVLPADRGVELVTGADARPYEQVLVGRRVPR